MSKLVFALSNQDADPDEIIEFALGPNEFRARKPTADQIATLTLLPPGGGEVALSRAVISFMDGILLDDGATRLHSLMARGVVTTSLLVNGGERNETGVIPAIIEMVTGNPTQSSTDSSTSPTSGGKKSTGRSPGKGSTLSDSPSTD